VNGFYADTPTQLREILLYLLQNPEEAHAIGHRGRELAMDIFNYDRYLNAWQETLFDLTKS
jgi:glycosyltransferase involved in cell wall biosynthesis